MTFSFKPIRPLTALCGVLLLGINLSTSSQSAAQHIAPQSKLAKKPLFRDPIHDGAADPTLIWNRSTHEWWMFYTNRRADIPTDPANPKDVAWVHGTRIGIAISKDHGASWTYRGMANIPYGKPDYTQWAPDIVYWKSSYHMFLVIVPGTFHNWNAPREIIHLTSPDLLHWKYVSKLETGSDRIIDPSLFPKPDGGWRVWYKDERDHSHIHFSDSTDLVHWSGDTAAITDRSSEAPKVFHWKGQYWMITDAWNGLGVYHSNDLLHWTVQPENLLAEPGKTPTDRSKGHHCDVIVNGDHAFIFYFTHQGEDDLDPKLTNSSRRTVLQVAELKIIDGKLVAERDQPTYVDLGIGQSSGN